MTAFEPDGYIVVSTDGRPLWQGWIEPYGHVELDVHSDDEVAVTEYAVM